MLLGLFLTELAAGLVLFLPLVGRRNAGVKFYRLTLIIAASLAAAASLAHALAGRRDIALADLAFIASIAFLYLVLRYPRRLVYRVAALLVGIAAGVLAVVSFHSAIRPPHAAWSVAGALSSAAILGSVVLAMTLGHWYLVVRGMPIDPLKRLTIATLFAAGLKIACVVAALASFRSGGFTFGTQLYRVVVIEGIFFWMRVGWGLAAPLLLFPMIWGTVRIRSTMAATGILYVAVVAVFIGEVLGAYLSSVMRVPL